MGRDEVLKLISRDIIDSPGVLDRFLREIRAVARLRHPNIVAAYFAFRAGGSLVFAMEYVEGLDLARMVKAKGPMPVSHACSFIHQAALGLQHAHQAGMVHRDIKPGNLMLTHEGDRAIIKVLDFGIAKAGREQEVLDPAPNDGGRELNQSSDLTAFGQMMGTPAFIAPEQIVDAQKADIRADIYSLGCTLYFLLSGRPPFEGATMDVLKAHRSTEAQPLNLVRSEVPAELADVVAKMMAKKPAQRFQEPAEVAKALSPFFKTKNIAVKGADPSASPGGQPEVKPEITVSDSSWLAGEWPSAADLPAELTGLAQVGKARSSLDVNVDDDWENIPAEVKEDSKPRSLVSDRGHRDRRADRDPRRDLSGSVLLRCHCQQAGYSRARRSTGPKRDTSSKNRPSGKRTATETWPGKSAELTSRSHNLATRSRGCSLTSQTPPTPPMS